MTPDDKESWPDVATHYEPSRPAPRKEFIGKRLLASLGFLVGCVPRRRSGRRALGVLTVLMAFAGTALLMYPFVTDIWAKSRQSDLRKQFSSKQAIDLYKRHQIEVGGALTRLVIHNFGACKQCADINVIVVEGISGNALRAGAGHYPTTALPGEQGNVAIAGHRTGFGEPFRHIDALRPGDKIILVTPLGRYTYQVLPPPIFGVNGNPKTNPWITNPKDTSVIGPTLESVLTLTSCDPPHTSKNRLIVRAKLIQSELAE
jgi:sortase A